MSEEQLAVDGWTNILTGLGRATRDKRVSTTFAAPTSLGWADLDLLYAGDWRVARIVDRPALDQTRRWFDVVVDGRRDRADEVHKRLRELGAEDAFRSGIAKARLYGTSLGIIFTDDGAPMEEPLRVERIRKIESIRIVDRWDASVLRWISDGRDPDCGLPEIYQLTSSIVDPAGNFLGARIHHTRVLRWEGVPTTRRRVLQLGGWSDSIVARVYSVVRDWAQSIEGAAHLMTDFAQAVLKIKGLAKMLGEDTDDLVLQRLQLIDMARSMVRMVPLDAESEEFERKPTPVSGLGEVLNYLRDELCGAADMPEKILFGKATTGLGDQGQSDLEQYYNGIEGEQKRNLLPQSQRLVAMIAAEQNFSVPSWEIEVRPLWTPTETEISKNRLQDAQSDKIRIETSVLTPEEIREARYGGDVYRAEVQIEADDPQDDIETPADPVDPAAAPSAEPSPETDPNAPAGKLDPTTTLKGAQIQAAAGLVTGVLSREITLPAAKVLARVGLGLQPADVEEMFSGVEAELETKAKRAEAIASQTGGPPQPPDPNNPRPEQFHGQEDPSEEE